MYNRVYIVQFSLYNCVQTVCSTQYIQSDRFIRYAAGLTVQLTELTPFKTSKYPTKTVLLYRKTKRD